MKNPLLTFLIEPKLYNEILLELNGKQNFYLNLLISLLKECELIQRFQWRNE